MTNALAALALALAAAAAGTAGPTDTPPALARPGRAQARGATGYAPSATCGGCHPRTLEQQLQSHHERAFTNPVFQAQYFEALLPRASRDPALAAEARSCTACHAPVAFANASGGGAATRAMATDPSLSGVTCDVCHTIRGLDGLEPLNGNFRSTPGPVKVGPLAGADNAHHAFSPLQSRSELCGTCHEATNRYGLRVKATYGEWRASPAARAGVQCQDCHMTRDGLVRAAAIGAGGFVRYTHRFPGAHSGSRVEQAVRLEIAPAAPAGGGGRRLAFEVSVDNARSGHRYPTGSADLRLLWLEVTAQSGGRPLPVSPGGAAARVAGPGRIDAAVLGADVPPGSRVYRAVFVDAEGRPTFASWDARRIAQDDRLPAGEVVREPYTIDLPADVRAAVSIAARLRYLPYPSAFATLMDLPAAAPVEVAEAHADVPVPGGR